MTTRAALMRVESAVVTAGGVFRQRGNTFRSTGVCHGGQRSESLVFFYDPGRGHVNVHCHAGCERAHVLAALGLIEADLFDEPRKGGGREPFVPRPRVPVRPKPEPVIFDPPDVGWRPLADSWMPCGHEKAAEYLYGDWESRVRFGVCRCTEKCFAQWRPDSESRSGRRWRLREVNDRGDVIATVLPVPYMLPQLLAGISAERTVYVVEGEKDVRSLAAAGYTATCNAEGAGKWTSQHAAYLAGADVTVVADRDVPGRKHAEKVVETLMPVARSVEVAVAAEGKDASDHLAAGRRVREFILVGTPKPFQPAEVL